MIAATLALLIQAATPAAPAADPDQQVRRQFAARGMSTAGIDTIFAIQRRHGAAVAAIVQRGRAAEIAMRTALTRRPVDIDGFARAVAARNEAGLALQREGADVTVQQMRALSVSDRAVLAGALTGPARPAVPAKR